MFLIIQLVLPLRWAIRLWGQLIALAWLILVDQLIVLESPLVYG